jgi:amino acid transporter
VVNFRLARHSGTTSEPPQNPRTRKDQWLPSAVALSAITDTILMHYWRDQGLTERSSAMPLETKSLVRAIGRWSLSALMLNTIIGASIFGLPSLLAAQLGKFSPAGYLVTAVGIAAIAACLAEVASQFREAGGPYLYTRVSFGPFAAIQIGWLTWLTRIVASAAAADLFVSYLGQFFPAVEAWAMRTMVLGMLIGFLDCRELSRRD